MSIDHEVRATPSPLHDAPIWIRPLEDRDHPWVARLHVQELPHGLFPRLGARFVTRWHRAHMASPFGRGLVAVRGGVPVGFLLGSTDRRAHVEWIVERRRGELACAGLFGLVRRPALAAWFIRTRAFAYARRLLRRSPSTTPGPEARSAPRGTAVLEAVMVVPGARKTGVGSLLVERFLASLAAAGSDHVELITKDGDAGAAGFYERRGWSRIRSHRDRDGDLGITFGMDLRRTEGR